MCFLFVTHLEPWNIACQVVCQARCGLPIVSQVPSTCHAVVFQLSPRCGLPLVTQLSPVVLQMWSSDCLPMVSQFVPICFHNGFPLVSDNFQLSPRWGPPIISQSTCLPLTSQMWSSHCLSSVSLGLGFETGCKAGSISTGWGHPNLTYGWCDPLTSAVGGPPGWSLLLRT
jgi:hypothetical protein